MATNKKVLVSTSEFPEAGMKILQDKFQVLQTKSNGFKSETMDDFKKEIEELIPGVEGIIWATKLYLGNELLNKAGNQLKVISCMSAGVDHIDVKNVKARKIAIGNTPNVHNGAVADLAVVLMIGAARRLTEGIQQVKSGDWEMGPQKMLGQDIKGSTVGIVGLGGIGLTIVKRLSGFEVGKIIYTGHKEKSEGIKLGAEFVTFDELLSRSDFVILSCPLNEDTKNMMNAEVFKKMKKTSILINVSRGEVIDHDALVKALKTKEIWAAGLDVTTPEPLPKDSPLISLQNCFLTPHLGSATVNTRNEMAQLAALNVVLGIQGEPLLTPL